MGKLQKIGKSVFLMSQKAPWCWGFFRENGGKTIDSKNTEKFL